MKDNPRARSVPPYDAGIAEYRAWVAMRQRCNNKNHKHFAHYGGRGIKVCKRWDKFKNFLSDMGARPSASHSVDRIDNNGNYEPKNCRWATTEIQSNNRSSTLWVLYNGEKISLKSFCKKIEISYLSVQQRRYKFGKSLEEAIRKTIEAKNEGL